MKILYVTQFFYPETAAAAIRAYENAKEWVRAGHDITILTGYPNFPTGKLFKGYTIRMLQKEQIDGINVFRSKIIVKPNTNKIMRAIAYLSFTIFGLLNLIFNKRQIEDDYDIVLATSGIVFAPIIGYYYSKRKKIPFVLELRDVTFKQILATGGSEKSISHKMVKWLELYLCRKAIKVVTLTKGFKRDLINEGIGEHKIEVITNGVKFKGYSEEYSKEIGYMELQKQPDEIVFSYMGTMGISQNLTGIIDFFRNLKVEGKKIKLMLIGDGAEKEKLILYIKNNNINNVIMLDSLPQRELERYYQMSDFCLVVLNNNSHFSNTIPSKIFHIMIHKKPILFFGPKGEASAIIEEAGAGLVLTDLSMEANSKIVTRFVSDLISNNYEEESARISANGFNFVKNHYNTESLAREYINILEGILK